MAGALTFGELLKRYRKADGVTQETLAAWTLWRWSSRGGWSGWKASTAIFAAIGNRLGLAQNLEGTAHAARALGRDVEATRPRLFGRIARSYSPTRGCSVPAIGRSSTVTTSRRTGAWTSRCSVTWRLRTRT